LTFLYTSHLLHNNLDKHHSKRAENNSEIISLTAKRRRRGRSEIKKRMVEKVVG
jgi:hypothetical protein